MRWKLLFEIEGKSYKAEKKVFEDLESSLEYASKICRKYIDNNGKKTIAKILSENKKEMHKCIFYTNGKYEHLIHMLEEGLYIPVKSSQSDFQKNAVYAWEEKAFTNVGFFQSTLKMYEARNFIEKIIKEENLNELEINFINSVDACFFKYAIDHSIKPSLNITKQWGLNKLVICHELAHYVIYQKGIKEDVHGLEFMGVYLYLLSKYTGAKEEKLWNSATKCGVKFKKYKKSEINRLID